MCSNAPLSCVWGVRLPEEQQCGTVVRACSYIINLLRLSLATPSETVLMMGSHPWGSCGMAGDAVCVATWGWHGRSFTKAPHATPRFSQASSLSAIRPSFLLSLSLLRFRGRPSSLSPSYGNFTYGDLSNQDPLNLNCQKCSTQKLDGATVHEDSRLLRLRSSLVLARIWQDLRLRIGHAPTQIRAGWGSGLRSSKVRAGREPGGTTCLKLVV